MERTSPSSSNQGSSRKQIRRGKNPIQFRLETDQSLGHGYSNTWICKNLACRAVLSRTDTFCQKCSCCICYRFDDNKDPSLWLVCGSEDPHDSCGLTCHIECAFKRGRVGVIIVGQFMHLDGSYCCASCGKVSEILGFLKKQLIIAKDARHVDVLCHRLSLSYRLLNGTSRYKELLDIVQSAMIKLESDVGPLDNVSTRMGRGIVSRLPVGSDVQKLCADAIEKVDVWLTNSSKTGSISRVNSPPAACGLLFEEVTQSSVVIVLFEIPTQSIDNLKGYKLWYSKSGHEMFSTDPIRLIPRGERSVLISNLEPCTEYTFKIVSYTDSGDLGHSEARCFTKSAEIIQKESNLPGSAEEENLATEAGKNAYSNATQEPDGYSHGIQVRDLCIDPNATSIPDLNEVFVPPSEPARDEGNGHASAQAVGATQKKVDPDVSHKRSSNLNKEKLDCNGTPINGSPSKKPGGLGEKFKDVAKIIVRLEREGHISMEFRMKFLSWFSSRPTERERYTVYVYIRTFMDDSKGLAGQLVDTFFKIVSS